MVLVAILAPDMAPWQCEQRRSLERITRRMAQRRYRMTDYPVTPDSIARAKAQAQAERDELNAFIFPQTGWFVDHDGHLRHVVSMRPSPWEVQ